MRPPAYVPLIYIADQRQRVEVYRKLAQITDAESLGVLRRELRDRFGPPPPEVEMLLDVAELKVIAAARGVTAIETRGSKLLLTRNHDLVFVGRNFPRLTESEASARVREIRRLLLSMESQWMPVVSTAVS